MRIISRRILGLSLCVAMIPALVTAQQRRTEDVLRPVVTKMRLGAVVGGQLNFSQGAYSTTCDCQYSAGSGFGLTGAVVADIPITGRIALLVEAGYQNRFTSYTETDSRLEYLKTSGTYVMADVERRAEVSLSMITFHAAAKWNTGFHGLFFTVGPTLGVLAANHFLEKESILTPGLAYDDTGLREKTFVDGDLDAAFGKKNALAFSIDAGVGYEFRVLPKLFLLPQLRYAYPLTSVTPGHADWKISSLRLLLQAEVLL